MDTRQTLRWGVWMPPQICSCLSIYMKLAAIYRIAIGRMKFVQICMCFWTLQPCFYNYRKILSNFVAKYEVIWKWNRIKLVLDQKGISQTWLAKQVGKSFSTINSYACNRNQPDLETLLAISKILQVDLKDLITDEDERL